MNRGLVNGAVVDPGGVRGSNDTLMGARAPVSSRSGQRDDEKCGYRNEEGVDAAAPTPSSAAVSIARQGRTLRSVPVAIQRPRATFGFWGFAMVAMRIRKTGLAHAAGMPLIVPEKRASP